MAIKSGGRLIALLSLQLRAGRRRQKLPRRGDPALTRDSPPRLRAEALEKTVRESNCDLAMVHGLVQAAVMASRSSRPVRSGECRREPGLTMPRPGVAPVEEQAAAVCYRIRHARIAFLLVRTRKGRWTFPKGRVERGFSHARAVGLEAFEEAGVHGRIEEVAFARYVRKKPGHPGEPTHVKVAVRAHLCQVLRLDVPGERYRSPAWFSAQQAGRHLEEQRAPGTAAQLLRVLERAITRIRQLQRVGLA